MPQYYFVTIFHGERNLDTVYFFVVCGDAVPMELISKVHKFNLLSSLMAKRSTSPINQIYVQGFSVRKKAMFRTAVQQTVKCKISSEFLTGW